MNRFIEHLKLKGYKIKGDRAILGLYSFRICSGNNNTAMGKQKSYWLELD